MTSLQTVINTVLSPSLEQSIAENSSYIIWVLNSTPAIANAEPTTIHKFKVRISALLNSKTPIVRWLGAVVARIAVQKDWEILASHGGTWAGILIHNLEVPQPPVNHEVSIQTLSTIFSLTFSKPDLSRTITTPRLPAYINLVIKLCDRSSEPDNINLALVNTSIPALNLVLRQQSTTFRPAANRYHQLLLKLLNLSITNPNGSLASSTVYDVCKGFVSLHMTASKGNEAEEWRKCLLATLAEIHYTLDELCSPLILEQHNTLDFGQSGPGLNLDKFLPSQNLAMPVQILKFNDKLSVVLTLLSCFFLVPCKQPVNIPLGRVFDLIDRIFSLNHHVPAKPGVETSARQTLLSVLESLHITTLNILPGIFSAIGPSALPHHDLLLHHLSVLIEVDNVMLRSALLSVAIPIYQSISTIPCLYNPVTIKLVNSSLSLLETKPAKDSKVLPDMVSNPDLFSKSLPESVQNTAKQFLQTVVETAPHVPLQTRAQIDRYFLLHDPVHKAVKTSALYPGSTAKYSILPMAIRMQPQDSTLMDMIHPRLPPLSTYTELKSATFREGNEDIQDGEEDIQDDELVTQDVKSPGSKDLQSEFISSVEPSGPGEPNGAAESFDQVKANISVSPESTETIEAVLISAPAIKPATSVLDDTEVEIPVIVQVEQHKMNNEKILEDPETMDIDINSESDSDFEIPEILVESDSDSE